MTKTVLWSSSAGDVPANLAFTNNFAATTNPAVTDDVSAGYTAGSVWINTSTNEAFLCTSNADGAAVWELMTTGSGTPGQVIAPSGSGALLRGGAPATVTSAGNAAQVTGAVGGATSGAGGEADLTGGAATGGSSTGGAAKATGGAGHGASAGGEADLTGGVGGATGAGGAAKVTGGAGGATSGSGGAASVTGGAGTNGNANGGDASVVGGAPNGSGVGGVTRVGGAGSPVIVNQGAPGALNSTGTLTAALMLAGIVTTTSAAAVAATLDVATNLDLALPTSGAGDSFDFSIINTGPNTLTVGTASGWTLVGVMTVVTVVSARFRARKTGGGAWVLYRLA